MLSIFATHGAVAQAAPSVSAASAILVDQDTGRVLYEWNADQKSLIASTTKIMTAFLVAEDCDPDVEFTVPPEACGIEGSSIYLKPGEVLPVRDLLYGLMLHSGNDAAVALAIACSGSVDAFVSEMNATAEELGLTQTHFANPNGLDDEGNYSTARDMAKLTRAALENELFAQVVATKTMKTESRSLSNHNKMLWRYEGADGVKTGFTKAAGRILVSSATRDGRQLIAVTMNAPDDWNDHTRLLDYGFERFEEKELVQAGQFICEIPVVGGDRIACGLTAEETVTFSVGPEEAVSFQVLAPDFLYAPVRQGQQIGTLQIRVNGHPVGQCALLAQDSVSVVQEEKKTFLQRLFGE